MLVVVLMTVVMRMSIARCTAPLLTNLVRWIYRCHVCVCVCSSLMSTEFVPTPYRCSSIDEVEAWLKVFACSMDIPFEKVKVFSIPGDALLSLTKDQCWELSRIWGIVIHNALRAGTVPSNLH